MLFAALHLSEPLLRAVESEGYHTATPIQAQAIPLILAGKDLMGCAQTGTGKTAAFALPILQRLSTHKPSAGHGKHRVRALVLAPTRELATQIADGFRTYGKNVALTHSVIFGGVSQFHQVAALKRGVDVLIATPGRLLDLIQQRLVDLSGVEVLVLDEADRMLDMGFINDIRKIIAVLPPHRQNLMFSATMPNEIRSLAGSILKHPENVHVSPVTATADKVDQCVYFVERRNKPALLAHLVESLPMTRAIVFARTKHGADRVVRQLHLRGIKAEAIHGNKAQNARVRALENFKKGKTPVLVATDIASRGIDVDQISHVVNYDLTHEPETYVHRIGRTARAGASGCAVSFCDAEERDNLRAIERLIRTAIPVREDHPDYSASPVIVDDRARPHREARPSRERGAAAPARRESRPHRDARPAHASHAATGHAPAKAPAKAAAPGASRPHAPAKQHSPHAAGGGSGAGHPHSRAPQGGAKAGQAKHRRGGGAPSTFRRYDDGAVGNAPRPFDTRPSGAHGGGHSGGHGGQSGGLRRQSSAKRRPR